MEGGKKVKKQLLQLKICSKLWVMGEALRRKGEGAFVAVGGRGERH